MTEKRPGAAVWIATCGGVGYSPAAPGTAGSAVGLALAAALGQLPLARPWLSAGLAAVAAGIFLLGVWAARHAERFFGRNDPREVVIDEMAGQMIPFLAWPQASWKWRVAVFVLFRIFDVLKPFPARRAERAPAGWGIMLDDVVAGLYSSAALLGLGFLVK